ncbi:MAG: toxin-antitoxin system YwqK family antitoxin, partial [Opitutae bacterium]|nr:toxin-antitoxin system YwqK family antitoxin [Opitutae bacterium]
MLYRILPLASLLSLASLLQGALEKDLPRLQSMTAEQAKNVERLSKVQLSGTFRLNGKGFASLSTPEGNFWVEEGKFSSGYKLIELDTSQSQPSALIQKGDQQAWIGLRSGIVPRTRVVGSDELEKRLDASGTTHIMYVVGESEPFTGMGVWYNKDGSKSRETVYENGKRNGTDTRYTSDGRRLETPYVNGKKHGMQTWYYETGNKKEETPYVDGIRHGTEVEYLDSKSRVVAKWRETPYVNGKEHGMQIRYRGDGSVEKVTPHENGHRHGMEFWYFKDGSTFYNKPFVNGKEHGMEIQYREDGSKRVETPWVDGKRIGMEIQYYEDGSKFSETPYVDGNANGTKIKYRQDGSKESETVYAKHKQQSQVWYR